MRTFDTDQVVIRLAHEADRRALARLADLDAHRPLEGPVLVAVVAGQARAALALDTGEAIADPFYPSARLVAMLRLRAEPALAA